MAELQEKRGKYPGFQKKWEQDGSGEWVSSQGEPMTNGWLVPDAVLDIQQAATAKKVKDVFEKHLALDTAGGLVPPLNRHRLLIPEPKLTWEQSSALVIAAFSRFDEKLGEKVAEVLADPSRIILSQVAVGESAAYVSPPGWQGRRRADMTFASDGTINDAVYLAHELGHLLAHDFAQDAGYDGDREETWMPKHVAEVPAFVTQNIFYDYLINGQENPVLKNAARQHAAGEATRSLYELQVGYANPAGTTVSPEEYAARMSARLGANWREFIKAASKSRSTSDLHGHDTAAVIGAGLYSSGVLKTPQVFDALFKRGKDTEILDVFAAAGLADEKSLAGFFDKAVTTVSKPLEDIYAVHAGDKAPAALPKAFAIRSNFV